jgi:hypothetical protein
MMHRVKNLTLALAALPMLFGTAAQAKTNLLRCQARTLRCESRFYRCLSRCDRRAAKRGDSGGDAQAKCETRCDNAYNRHMAYIEAHPPCQDVVVTPDPMLCEAFYLAAEARFQTCQASCAARSNSTSCLTSCTTSHDTALDQLKVNPVCAEGRPSSSMVPVQN